MPLPHLETAALDWRWVEEEERGAEAEGSASGKADGGREGGGCEAAARGPFVAILSEAWELVVGSDLVYNEAGKAMLPRLLGRLLCSRGGARGVSMYYAHTLNRYEFYDRDFFAALEAQGLSYVQAWPQPEGDGGGLGAEGAFSGELFPEQRIVVLRISRAPVDR